MKSQFHQNTAAQIIKLLPDLLGIVFSQMRRTGHPSHYMLLAALYQQSCSLSELAERQAVSLPSISSSVTTLEQRGWLRRVPAQHDRRVVFAEITGEGRAAFEEMQIASQKGLSEFLDSLTEEDLIAISDGLGLLQKALTHTLVIG